MDDAEGLTPGRHGRRREPGIRSTGRPRPEPSETAGPAPEAEEEAASVDQAPDGDESPDAGDDGPPAEATAPALAATAAVALPEVEDDPLGALRSRLRARAEPDPVAAGPTRSEMPALEAVERSRAADDERRRQLWRDSATILIGVVLVLLLGQTFFPQVTSGPDGSPTPLPSTINIGSLGPPVSLPPGATFGPIIDPSLGIDRTPTPIPVITMGPTPTPSPSPEPSATKKPSPKPTTKPTPKPTAKPSAGSSAPPPTAEPTVDPTPVITDPPPPTVSLSCNVPALSMTVTCAADASNIVSGSYDWSMGGDGTAVSGGDGSSTAEWTYSLPGAYTVSVSVAGTDGGTDTDEQSVTVPGA